MEENILAFMKEKGISTFAAADRTTGVVHIDKLGDLESYDLFQQLVLYSDADTLCDSTGSQFPFRLWGQGGTNCLISWLDGGKAAALFFDSELSGAALTKWVSELDQRVRRLYGSEE